MYVEKHTSSEYGLLHVKLAYTIAARSTYTHLFYTLHSTSSLTLLFSTTLYYYVYIYRVYGFGFLDLFTFDPFHLRTVRALAQVQDTFSGQRDRDRRIQINVDSLVQEVEALRTVQTRVVYVYTMVYLVLLGFYWVYDPISARKVHVSLPNINMFLI
jgi:hypothetical protein